MSPIELIERRERPADCSIAAAHENAEARSDASKHLECIPRPFERRDVEDLARI